jgi:ABC-type Mn2+/Zn2+ transport system permease subunit
MLGWMIVFALMTLPGAAAAAVGYHPGASLMTATVVFAGLFIAGLFTCMVRGMN